MATTVIRHCLMTYVRQEFLSPDLSDIPAGVRSSESIEPRESNGTVRSARDFDLPRSGAYLGLDRAKRPSRRSRRLHRAVLRPSVAAPRQVQVTKRAED